MKDWKEMNVFELCALTSEEAQEIEQRILVLSGIVEVPHPGPKPSKEDFIGLMEKTVKGFKVGDLVFQNIEDAEKVIAMKPCKEAYDYSGLGYYYRYLVPAEEEVTHTMYFTKEDVEERKDAGKKLKEAEDAYGRKEEEYEKYKKQTSVLNEFREKIVLAGETIWYLTKAKNHMKRVFGAVASKEERLRVFELAYPCFSIDLEGEIGLVGSDYIYEEVQKELEDAEYGE
jgi:hypothetical protein